MAGLRPNLIPIRVFHPAIIGLLMLGPIAATPRDEPRSLHGTESKLAEATLAAHNRIRSEQKLPPLVRHPLLDAAALAHARDMAQRREMSHVGGDGSEAFVRVDRQRYPYRIVGENVARGQRSAERVMKGWMESPGHKKNILGDYEEVGLAVALDDRGDPYWCVNFARPWPDNQISRARPSLLRAVNDSRSREGLPALRLDERLNRLAEQRASSFAKSPGDGDREAPGEEFAMAVRASGYRYLSLMDMTAGAVPDSEALVEYFLKQPDYRKALLGPYKDLGLGLSKGAHGTPYWDLVLGTPR